MAGAISIPHLKFLTISTLISICPSQQKGDEWHSEGFTVKTTPAGKSARELNSSLLSAFRRIEKDTTPGSQRTCDGVTERYFDYVPKGTRKK